MTATPISFVSQGIKAIQGVSFQTMNTGTLSSSTPLPRRPGDVLISTTTGKWYFAGQSSGKTTASSDWLLVTNA